MPKNTKPKKRVVKAWAVSNINGIVACICVDRDEGCTCHSLTYESVAIFGKKSEANRYKSWNETVIPVTIHYNA